MLEFKRMEGNGGTACPGSPSGLELVGSATYPWRQVRKTLEREV